VTDAERIYQLMVLTARADETVDAREARVMAGIVDDTAELQGLGDRAALTRAARSLLERKGLIAAGRPQYVVRIDREMNCIVIGDDPQRRRFSVRDHNWIAIETLNVPIRCDVQIRNRFEPKPATVFSNEGLVTVEFDEPQRAITPGQAAVFYWGDVVVGGGWIQN